MLSLNEDIDSTESEWPDATRPLPLVDDALTQGLSDKYRDLLVANEQLMITLAATQELLDTCAQGYLPQLDLLTQVARALHDLGDPVPIAANQRSGVGADEKADRQSQELIRAHVAQLARKVDDLIEASRASVVKLQV